MIFLKSRAQPESPTRAFFARGGVGERGSPTPTLMPMEQNYAFVAGDNL